MSRKINGYSVSLLRQYILLATLSCCIFQGASGQIGLMSASMAPMTSQPGGILALPLTASAQKPATSSLFSKLSDRQLPPPRSASTRESEIAAIFRGVAYGAPTFSSNTTTTTTSTPPSTKDTTTITTSTIATPTVSMRNGVADPIRSKLTRHGFEKDNEYSLTSSAMPDLFKSSDESFSYALHENTGKSDVSYLHLTPDPSSALSSEKKPMATDPTDILDALVINKKSLNDREHHFPTADVKWTLGVAWWVHVYVSAGLFALVSAASLCCLARLSPPSHLLSRANYIFLLILIFLATILRCLHLFHDPYGIENRLPKVFSAFVEETSWPCLTGALAVVALTLYQSGSCSRIFPKCSCLPFVLPFFTLVFAIITVGVHLCATMAEKYFFPLRLAAQSIAVSWGGVVGIACLWAIWRVERSNGRYNGHLLGRLNRSATDELVSSGQPQTAVHRGALLTLVSSVAQIMLTALHLYIMLAPAMPTKYVWVWWGRVSMARGLELIISISILTTAYILTAGRSSNSQPDNNIFSVLTNCGKDGKNTKIGRTANVFPIQNEKRQILGSFNFHSTKPPIEEGIKKMPVEWTYTIPRNSNKAATTDSVTSDFQLLWNRDRTQSVNGFRPSSMLVNDSGFVRFRTHIDPEQAMEEVFNKSSLNLHKIPTPIPYSNVQNYSTQTLPSNRYYCPPSTGSFSSPERTPLRNPIRAHTVRSQRCKPDYLQYHMRNRAMSQIRDKQSWTPITSASRYDMRALDKYEVASYYNSSLASTGSNMYAVPHVVPPNQQLLNVHGSLSDSHNQIPSVHGSHHLYEEAGNIKRISPEAASGIMEPSTCSSMSEIHVDYLTDISSSNDCMNQGSIPYMNRSKRNQNQLTLPLSSAHSNYTAQTHPTYTTPTKQIHLPDITPDSAVILDYSTSAETEEDMDKDEKNKSVDLLKLSSNSLNDMLKGQARAGLLSKIVGGGMSGSCYGYSPLDVEDTSSPSQEDSTITKTRRLASFTDAAEGNETPKISSPSSPITLSQIPSTVTSL